MLLAPSIAPPVDPIEVTTSTLSELSSLTLRQRTYLGLTTTQAAEQVGIGATTYSGVETGSSNPTLNTVKAVLTWLRR